MTSRTTRSTAVPLLALAALLALSACGGSGGDSPDAEASTAASGTAAPSAEGSAAATAPASSATSPAGDTAAAMPRCTADLLSAAVETQPGGGAAGSVYRTLVLTNDSSTACATGGYPGVSYVDAAGSQVGAPAARAEGEAVPLVLEPGRQAAAELRETRAQNYGDECAAADTAALLVYPPDDTASLRVEHPSLGCGNEEIELLSVGVLQQR